MDFGDDKELSDRLDALVDFTVGAWPPKRLVKLLCSLVADQPVRALLGTVSRGQGATGWRLFALTDKRLILVEGDANVGGWRWESDSVEHANESARSVPLAEVGEIRVDALFEQRLGFGGSSAWISDYSFELSGESISLPVATKHGNADQRERIERFAKTLIELTT